MEEGWEEEERVIETVAESEGKWVERQIWGMVMLNGERKYLRNGKEVREEG